MSNDFDFGGAVPPWGRSAAEYEAFFALSDIPPSARILPFLSESFDLVLCSHLLFLYSAEFDAATHLSFLRELLRVGREVRVFPLFDMDGNPSAHLDNTIQALRASTRVELVPLSFEFRSGDSKMLRLTH